jgi:hypothetical protein
MEIMRSYFRGVFDAAEIAIAVAIDTKDLADGYTNCALLSL